MEDLAVGVDKRALTGTPPPALCLEAIADRTPPVPICQNKFVDIAFA